MGGMAWTVEAVCAVVMVWLIFKWCAKCLISATSRKNFTRASTRHPGQSQASESLKTTHAHTRRKPD